VQTPHTTVIRDEINNPRIQTHSKFKDKAEKQHSPLERQTSIHGKSGHDTTRSDVSIMYFSHLGIEAPCSRGWSLRHLVGSRKA
jgi:hypothetical protein